MNEIFGIDISSYQGAVDWNALSKNKDVSFVIIRVAQGRNQDSRFSYNITECHRVGIPYGLYFAASATTEKDAILEAEFAEGYGRLYAPTYGMWYDMELLKQKQLGKRAISDMIRAWLSHVSAAGYRCGTYTNKDWLDTRIERDIIEDYDLWYAAYPSKSDERTVLTEAPKNNRDKLSYPMAKIWQWSKKGQIDGIISDVDFNVCYEEYEPPKIDRGYVTISEAKEILGDLGYKGIIL